jgi:hypothetical protein
MPTPNSAFAVQASSEDTFTAGTNPSFAITAPPTGQANPGGYNPDFPSAPFFGQGGAQPAASWPSDSSLFDLNNVELFAGFDIPFWLDDEQYVPFLDNQ